MSDPTTTQPASLSDRIAGYSAARRNRIGVGLRVARSRCVAELRRASELVDVVVVGPNAVDGLPHVPADGPDRLFELQGAGEIDAIFHGNFDAVQTYAALRRHAQGDLRALSQIAPFRLRPMPLAGNTTERIVCLTPISPTNTRSATDRVRQVGVNVAFFEDFGVKPRIAAVSAGKVTDVAEDVASVTSTIFESEYLVRRYGELEYDARHVGHQLERALPWADVIGYADAFCGNQVTRVLMFTGAAVPLPAMVVGLPFVIGHVPELIDEWCDALAFLNAMTNRRREAPWPSPVLPWPAQP